MHLTYPEKHCVDFGNSIRKFISSTGEGVSCCQFVKGFSFYDIIEKLEKENQTLKKTY